MTIKIKNGKVLGSLLLVGYHPKLIAIAIWIYRTFGKLYITSGYRKGDKGVHGTISCRGMDIRSNVYHPDPQVVVDAINVHFRYDPLKRPEMMCAVYHAVCPNPECGHNNSIPYHPRCEKCNTNITLQWHIHLQVHDNTQYLRDDMPETRPNDIHGF